MARRCYAMLVGVALGASGCVIETSGPAQSAGTVDWSTNATRFRGQNGTRVTYVCPGPGSARTVWGTDLYTDDSSVCTAGVHAGRLTLGGGSVTIELRPGASGYVGSARNGVTSSNYGSWSGSFVFP